MATCPSVVVSKFDAQPAPSTSFLSLCQSVDLFVAGKVKIVSDVSPKLCLGSVFTVKMPKIVFSHFRKHDDSHLCKSVFDQSLKW